jgi:hypothetical protein
MYKYFSKLFWKLTDMMKLTEGFSKKNAHEPNWTKPGLHLTGPAHLAQARAGGQFQTG